MVVKLPCTRTVPLHATKTSGPLVARAAGVRGRDGRSCGRAALHTLARRGRFAAFAGRTGGCLGAMRRSEVFPRGLAKRLLLPDATQNRVARGDEADSLPF